MKRIIIFLSIVLAMMSCQRRPLTTADNNVLVNIEIEKDIVNYEMTSMPELMRTAFFNRSGNFSAHSFLPHRGGFVNLIPAREYDMIVYNFGTRSTLILEEYEFDGIFATTNEVSENYKRKLKSRSTGNKEELIVFEPDHLFTGTLNDIYVPARGADSPPVEFDVYAKTVVQTWKIKIDRIQGMEWVSRIAGVVTGLSKGNSLSRNEKSKEQVSVYFEPLKVDENGLLEAAFNTFGYLPDRSQVLSLVVTDISGQGHEFNIDISGQFPDNEEQTIYVRTGGIVIDKPEPKPGTGGGLVPEVDNWQNVETDIVI